MDRILLHPQCRLITFSIVYYLPDFPSMINELSMQKHDLVPRLPRLYAFLKFWEENIDGPIKSVRVDYPDIKIPRSIRFADKEFSIN